MGKVIGRPLSILIQNEIDLPKSLAKLFKNSDLYLSIFFFLFLTKTLNHH